MQNQIALRILAQPGDDVIVSRESHAVWHESGAGAVNAGVQFTEIGGGGTFTAEAFRAACKPQGHFLYPGTALVEIFQDCPGDCPAYLHLILEKSEAVIVLGDEWKVSSSDQLAHRLRDLLGYEAVSFQT